MIHKCRLELLCKPMEELLQCCAFPDAVLLMLTRAWTVFALRRRVAAGAGRSPEHAQDEQVSTGRAAHLHFGFPINHFKSHPAWPWRCWAVPCLFLPRWQRDRAVRRRDRRGAGAREGCRGGECPSAARRTGESPEGRPRRARHPQRRPLRHLKGCPPHAGATDSLPPTSDHARFSQDSCSICECHRRCYPFCSSSNIRTDAGITSNLLPVELQ